MAKDILFEIQELSNDPRFIDLTGSKFGLLQVIGYVGRKPGGALWLCSCDAARYAHHLRLQGVFSGVVFMV